MEESKSRLRVALYVRVSSDEQKQGHTIDSQVSELRQFAAQKEWSVISVYSDEAWSGASLARPELDRMRDDARRKAFDAVLINDVDRLARDVTHLGIIKRDLERSGTKVIFRKIPSENSPTHNLLVNMLGSFAEFEREIILDRTRRGRLHKVETRQQFIGAIAPFGYRYTPLNASHSAGVLQIQPDEGVTVRKMFEWVDLEGLSARQVADRLTRDRFPTRKGGEVWRRSSVLRILRGSIYIGTWFYNKHKSLHEIPGYRANANPKSKAILRRRSREEWIPVAMPENLRIISQQQWHRVQKQLDRNRCFSPRNSKHQYLLSSLLRCAGCQGPLCGNPSHGGFSYRCVNRCRRVREVSEPALNDAVWQTLERALQSPRILSGSIRKIESRIEPGPTEVRGVEVALGSIDGEEKRILEAYRLGIITPEQLSNEMNLLRDRRAVLENEQGSRERNATSRAQLQKNIDAMCKEFQDRLKNLSFEAKRAVIRLLVTKIVFDGNHASITGVIPMELDELRDATSKLRSAGKRLGNPLDQVSDSDAAEPWRADTGIAAKGVDPYERNPGTSAWFEIVSEIPKISERKIAASLRNLVLATQALQRIRTARSQRRGTRHARRKH